MWCPLITCILNSCLVCLPVASLVYNRTAAFCTASLQINHSVAITGTQPIALAAAVNVVSSFVLPVNSQHRQHRTWLHLGGLQRQESAMFGGWPADSGGVEPRPGFVGCIYDLSINGGERRIFK